MDPIAQRLALVLGALFLVAFVFIVASERLSGRPAGKLWTSYWLQFVIVGALLVPAYLGGGWWIALILALFIVTTWEMRGVLRVKDVPIWGWLVNGAGFVMLFLAAGFGWPATLIAFGVVAVALGVGAAVGRRREAVGHLLAIAFPGLCLAFSLSLGLQHGFAWVAYLYAIVELNDAVALMVGKFFGKTLIWPRLSPSKTVAGSVAGLVAAVGAAFAFWFLVPGLAWTSVLAIGLGLGVLGQAADLAASAVKRWAGVKDYSNAVPTHGGVLDVYDSFILTSPFFFALSQWLR